MKSFREDWEILKRNPWRPLLYSILFLVLGGLSAWIGGGFSLYSTLDLPPFSPPGAIFPIVWTILYIGLGVSAALFLEAAPSQEDRQRGGLFFFTMMLFNYLWTPLFFRLNAYFPALIDIVVMIVLTIAVLPYLRKSTRLGHLLTTVFLIWLFYAFYLTLGVVILNKTSIH